MSSKSVAVKSPRKLIEVALPLDKINQAAAREKSIRHGHPSTLHLWWARRPLAAARAVLFAQLVNDPGYERHLNRGVNKIEAAKERERLFKIIEELVLWQNTNNEELLTAARAEIARSWWETCELNRNHPEAATLFIPEKLPAFHDPFAGGGAIPLEAQRLGLESYASDLNPVAVTINKALIEFPPRFAGGVPIGPLSASERDPSLSRKDWPGATGLAEDVRRYGVWIGKQAQERIGHLYPKVEITALMAVQRPDLAPLVGQTLEVIAWLCARTVKSPNPAYSHIDVPLSTSFVPFARAGSECYLEVVKTDRRFRIAVRKGSPPDAAWDGTKIGRGSNFRCVVSETPISAQYIKAEAAAGRMGHMQMALVVQSPSGRICLEVPSAESNVSSSPETWAPDVKISGSSQYIGVGHYGLTQFSDVFLERQLQMLDAFVALVEEAIAKCRQDAAGLPDAAAYADAVGLYLGITLSKLTAYHCTLAVWRAKEVKSGRAFGMQTMPMVWDFPECNPFANAGGDWLGAVNDCSKVLSTLGLRKFGCASQVAAQSQTSPVKNSIVSTDPPYYDNVPYADLSDFFYVWLRRGLRNVLPAMFGTVATPKKEELVAFAYRHADKEAADVFFMHGMEDALRTIWLEASSAYPITLYSLSSKGRLTRIMTFQTPVGIPSLRQFWALDLQSLVLGLYVPSSLQP